MTPGTTHIRHDGGGWFCSEHSTVKEPIIVYDEGHASEACIQCFWKELGLNGDDDLAEAKPAKLTLQDTKEILALLPAPSDNAGQGTALSASKDAMCAIGVCDDPATGECVKCQRSICYSHSINGYLCTTCGMDDLDLENSEEN